MDNLYKDNFNKIILKVIAFFKLKMGELLKDYG